MFLNSILPKHLPNYISMYIIYPCKISARSMYDLRNISDLVKLVSRYFKAKFRDDLICINTWSRSIMKLLCFHACKVFLTIPPSISFHIKMMTSALVFLDASSRFVCFRDNVFILLILVLRYSRRLN
jgi:hypothetical protein